MAVRFEDWEPLYQRILQAFGYDRRADEAAAAELARALRPASDAVEAGWAVLAGHLGGASVVVLGAGDSALDELRAEAPGRLVTADGATTAALEAGRVPDLIVTDLDGVVEDQVEACRRGSYVAVHAHGDNRAAVARWLPRFPSGRVLGTCQSRPSPPLRNYGGFTDGDRACFVAHGLGAARMRLRGFDTLGRPGRYTGRFDPAVKPRKLEWAARLIAWLGERGASIEPSPSSAKRGTGPARPASSPSEGTGPRTGEGRARAR